MAEILEQKLANGAVAITSADMDELIATIGRPSDLGDGPKEKVKSAPNGEKKKLYRDASKSGKFIAGVCVAVLPITLRLIH